MPEAFLTETSLQQHHKEQFVPQFCVAFFIGLLFNLDRFPR